MEMLDLNFQLNVDGPSFEELRNWFHEEWTDLGIEWQGHRTGSTAENRVEFNKHLKGERYPYYILVDSKRNTAPDLDDTDLKRQVEFARQLIARLRENGCILEFNSFFEEYL